MNQITVECLHSTPLHISSHAIRECHNSHTKSDTAEHNGHSSVECGPKDAALIHRIGCKLHHESTLEHVNFSYSIQGISVAVLGQLTRHRLASYTVQSTRYTTKQYLSEGSLTNVSDVCVQTGNSTIDDINRVAITDLVDLVASSVISNDELRYALPQAWRTNLTMTINLRSLRNLIQLRTTPHTMAEFQHLAQLLLDATPEEYHYLLTDCVYQSSQA